MALADLNVRSGALRLARATAALLAVGTTAVVVAAPPAAAHYGLSGKITADCIVRGSGNTYKALFGYDNTGPRSVTIPVGPANAMQPSSLNGVQTTTFAPGAHRGAFATGWRPTAEKVTWTVGSMTATASTATRTCGPSVSLPADGNGTGPVFALGGSVLIAFGVLAVRRRRQRPRGA